MEADDIPTDAQIADARAKVMAAFEALLKHDPTMHIRSALAFAHVALQPGCSVTEYERRAGISQSSMSRLLQDLGTRNRHHEPGLELVEHYDAPENRRQREIRLTHKGAALYHTLAHVLLKRS